MRPQASLVYRFWRGAMPVCWTVLQSVCGQWLVRHPAWQVAAVCPGVFDVTRRGAAPKLTERRPHLHAAVSQLEGRAAVWLPQASGNSYQLWQYMKERRVEVKSRTLCQPPVLHCFAFRGCCLPALGGCSGAAAEYRLLNTLHKGEEMRTGTQHPLDP